MVFNVRDHRNRALRPDQSFLESTLVVPVIVSVFLDTRNSIVIWHHECVHGFDSFDTTDAPSMEVAD